MKKTFTSIPSSRSVSVRDIGRLFIPRTTTLRGDDEQGVKGFTLIELLVVVLIIGILSAVALPQYEKAVERAKMTEAVTLVRAIANAHQVYYLANGVYLNPQQIDLLDIKIPGQVAQSTARIKTKDFVYAPNGCNSSCTDPENLAGYLALATRVSASNESLYQIFIQKDSPNLIHCARHAAASTTQRQLCDTLDANGTL